MSSSPWLRPMEGRVSVRSSGGQVGWAIVELVDRRARGHFEGAIKSLLQLPRGRKPITRRARGHLLELPVGRPRRGGRHDYVSTMRAPLATPSARNANHELSPATCLSASEGRPPPRSGAGQMAGAEETVSSRRRRVIYAPGSSGASPVSRELTSWRVFPARLVACNPPSESNFSLAVPKFVRRLKFFAGRD